jgi:DNA-binding transcriptional ArsR family regulator
MNDEHGAVSLPNRLIHEPARLAILTVLSSCASADFSFLQNATGLTKGNLSVQLTNLEAAGLVIINKEIVERKMRTTVTLSKRGASGIESYWKAMDAIRTRMIGEEKQSSRRKRSIPLRARLSTTS